MPTFRKKCEVNNRRVKSRCYKDSGPKIGWKLRCKVPLGALRSDCGYHGRSPSARPGCCGSIHETRASSRNRFMAPMRSQKTVEAIHEAPPGLTAHSRLP